MVRTVLNYCIPGVRKLPSVPCSVYWNSTRTRYGSDTPTNGTNGTVDRLYGNYRTMQPVHIRYSSDAPTVKKAITKFIMVNKQMNKIMREEKAIIEHSPEMRGRQGA